MLAVYASAQGGEDPLKNLEVGEIPEEVPAAGWATIRMRASSLNHHDLWTLRGVGAPASSLPRVLGCDVSGIVEGYGPGEWRPYPEGTAVVVHSVITCGRCDACLGPDETGCRHFALFSEGTHQGTMAEFCHVPVANLLPLPAGLSFAQAACLPTAYLTAYRMLFTKAELRPGDTVLIQGAGGGLATAAETLALRAGIRVLVSSRSEHKRQAALERGAQLAVAPGREAVSQVMEATQGTGVDAVIESVGEPTWATSLRALRRGGAVVVAGATAGADPPSDLRRIFWRQLRVLGSTMGTRREFTRLLAMISALSIAPVIDSEFPLEQAARAFAKLEAGEAVGKLVLLRD